MTIEDSAGDVIEDVLTWSEYRCKGTHLWAWLNPKTYNCPICRWGIGYEDTWLGGKPVGVS